MAVATKIYVRLLLVSALLGSVLSFSVLPGGARLGVKNPEVYAHSSRRSGVLRASALKLRASSIDDKTAGAVAAVSFVAIPVMLWSEFTLKTTGCGLPAGPGGSLGALEGISYLWVLGLVGFSAFTKIKTGKGLPNGPAGLLGAAEGLAYLAILAGVVVLGFQIADYGYIPNAVPVEGGKCS